MIPFMRRNKIDDLITSIFEKHMYEICIFFIVFFSILIRILLAPHTISGDYNVTLSDWINQYRSFGFGEALGKTIGNYYVPYNIFLNLVARSSLEPWFWIALTSCIAEYIGSYFLYKIFVDMGGEKKLALVAAIVPLFLPVAVINGSLWKQCDSIYTCFIILSLYYYYKDKMTRSFVFLAIGFVFKMQIIFVLPFYIIMYFIKKNYSIFQFMWMPIMYIIAGIPCVIMQRGIRETYSVYIRQNSGYNQMTWLSNSLYRLGFSDFKVLGAPAIILTVTIFAFALCFIHKYRENIDNRLSFMIAGWGILTCYVFLPAMHERYDYAAIILISAFVVMYRRKMFFAALAFNLCSVCVYNLYLFDFQLDNEVFFIVISVIYLIAYFVYTLDMIALIKKCQ